MFVKESRNEIRLNIVESLELCKVQCAAARKLEGMKAWKNLNHRLCLWIVVPENTLEGEKVITGIPQNYIELSIY